MAYSLPLLSAIRSSARDRALQEALVATTLVESSGNTGARGDGGHSWGAYQENDWGRGAGIPIAGRQDPVASTRRAVAEFSRFRRPGLSVGQWAANAQRPADRAGYARKIMAALPQARALLGGAQLSGPPAPTMLDAPATGSGFEDQLAMSILSGRPITQAVREASFAPDVEVPDQLAGPQNDVVAKQPDPAYNPGKAGTYDWAQGLAKRFGLRLASTYRDPARNAAVGGSKTSAHMRYGAAADFAGPADRMRQLAAWAMNQASSGAFQEVFYDPLGQWDSGRRSRRGIGGHLDHVHITRG